LPLLPKLTDNAAMQADPPKRKRRWFQFSLRTLFVFTLVCAIPCAWLGRKIERKRQERQVAEAIVKLRGRVFYDCEIGEWDVNGQVRVEGPRGPAWLRKLLGEYFFSDVELVNLDDVQDADAALVNASRLAQVQWISLDNSNVTDTMLTRLNGLPQLRTLSLRNTKITDAGLANLKRLSHLTELTLVSTEITDGGLVHLKGLANLQRLDLDETNVSDAGLEDLKGLTKLRYLWLANTQVTDAGVDDLQTMLAKCKIEIVETQLHATRRWTGDPISPQVP
jgi:Leucine rich repeat/Leucine Rich repeat